MKTPFQSTENPLLTACRANIETLEAHARNIEQSDDQCYTNGRMRAVRADIDFAKALHSHAALTLALREVEARLPIPFVGMKTFRNTSGRTPLAPVFGSDEAAGADLHAYLYDDADFVVIPSGQRAIVPTGLGFEIPKGYEGQVRPRSGLAANKGLTVLNTPGTIDSDFRGEVQIILFNTGSQEVTVTDGERIAQLVITKVERPTYFFTGGELSKTARGTGGFGSTGA